MITFKYYAQYERTICQVGNSHATVALIVTADVITAC